MTNTEPWQVWKLDRSECLIYLHSRFVELLDPDVNNQPLVITPARPSAAKPKKSAKKKW